MAAARWITPEPLNVSPALVGAPLASPARRAAAIAIDGLLIGMLSGVNGGWLLGGLALVVLQLRSRRGATSGPRLVVGWVGAVLLGVLALSELSSQWVERERPTADERRAEAKKVVHALVAAASTPASAAGPALEAALRIAALEAELAEARRARPAGWRESVRHSLDDIGLGFGWGIVYFSLLPAWWGGQTVGKKLLRLRVVELTGKPMTVLRCLRRYGGYAAGMATGGMGFLQMLWDPNRQTLQDRTAHTAVIDLRLPWATSPPSLPATPQEQE